MALTITGAPCERVIPLGTVDKKPSMIHFVVEANNQSRSTFLTHVSIVTALVSGYNNN